MTQLYRGEFGFKVLPIPGSMSKKALIQQKISLIIFLESAFQQSNRAYVEKEWFGVYLFICLGFFSRH